MQTCLLLLNYKCLKYENYSIFITFQDSLCIKVEIHLYVLRVSMFIAPAIINYIDTGLYFSRALRSMRNYIHIHLCISLAISQLTFVAGVDKASNTETVPVHCQVVAVLLHYFFLVSFMWMLMEGVVLYVVLVRVFVKHKKRYLVAFTVSSYGLPLLYMGLITLPLGFLLPSSEHYYGNEE